MQKPLFERQTSMSEISLLKQEVQNLTHATATYNSTLNVVILRFNLEGKEGFFMLKATETEGYSASEILRKKLTAVARTQLLGSRPADNTQIAKILKKGFGQRAIRILINGLTLVGGLYDGVKWGIAAKWE